MQKQKDNAANCAFASLQDRNIASTMERVFLHKMLALTVCLVLSLFGICAGQKQTNGKPTRRFTQIVRGIIECFVTTSTVVSTYCMIVIVMRAGDQKLTCKLKGPNTAGVSMCPLHAFSIQCGFCKRRKPAHAAYGAIIIIANSP